MTPLRAARWYRQDGLTDPSLDLYRPFNDSKSISEMGAESDSVSACWCSDRGQNQKFSEILALEPMIRRKC